MQSWNLLHLKCIVHCKCAHIYCVSLPSILTLILFPCSGHSHFTQRIQIQHIIVMIPVIASWELKIRNDILWLFLKTKSINLRTAFFTRQFTRSGYTLQKSFLSFSFKISSMLTCTFNMNEVVRKSISVIQQYKIDSVLDCVAFALACN